MVNYVYFYAVKSNKLLIVEKTATSEDWLEQKIKACLLSTCFLRYSQSASGAERCRGDSDSLTTTTRLPLKNKCWVCLDTPLTPALYLILQGQQ